jgi:primosomal protein N' (replication factor Y)
MIAKVAVNRPIKETFDYEIPADYKDKIKVGQRVKVEFKNLVVTGFVVGIFKKSKYKKLKNIKKILDKQPVIDNHLLKLTRQIADYYLCSWGQILNTAFPMGLKKTKLEDTQIVKKIIPKIKKPPSKEKNSSSANKDVKKIIRNKHKVYLYHYSKNKDKMDFYTDLISKTIEKNRKVLILVPEVISADLLFEGFKDIYSDRIVLFYSRLKVRQKRENLKRIIDNEADIVIGTRSACFAPLKDIGLILIDEEESPHYKKPDTPRINAKKVAEIRAKMLNCPVVLASVSPSVETYYQTERKNYHLIDARYKESSFKNNVQVLDLKKEKDIYKRKGFMSYFLKDKIEESLKNGKKAVLFLNRRGFATYVRCRKCGYVIRCKRCKKPLTYHYDKKKLICHYCNYQQEPPKICPKCKSSYLSYSGFGTEKLESTLYHKFPNATIKRLDADTAVKKGARYKTISEFNDNKIDILIGTQIIFKGLNFNNTGVVAVINADTGIHMPDFRAQENTFNTLYNITNRLLLQNEEAKIIIQTYLPEHFAIKHAATGEYNKFYKKEVKQRKDLDLPPYYHFNFIKLRAKNKKRLISKTEKLSKIIMQKSKSYRYVKITEPQLENILKIRDYYRQKIIIKSKKMDQAREIIEKSLNEYKKTPSVIITLDIDAVEYS